jgi:signal transduction histidine kinase
MVVVQAQTAPHRLGGVSPEVQREFDSIGEQARQALNEVRGMLGVLRSDGQLAESVPQPGLGQVETLLRESRDAGLDLTWTVTGDPAGCSDASAMVVVRVLQESLANASRHARGSRVRVEVEYVDQLVRLAVSNSAGGSATAPDGSASQPVGDGSPPAAPRHGGAGLVGMRARVSALGGRLVARPLPDGGFEVRAEVPKAATGAAHPVS